MRGGEELETLDAMQLLPYPTRKAKQTRKSYLTYADIIEKVGYRPELRCFPLCSVPLCIPVV